MAETLEILDIIRLATGALILLYASYTDIKIRQASNKLWLVMGSIAIILLIIQYFTEGFENYFYLIFIPVMIGLVYLLFQLRVIFGGADAKALMAIAILVPIEPSFIGFPIQKGAFMPFSWTIFQNSLIIFLFIPLSLFIFNIFKRNLRFPNAFLGYVMDIETARKKFVWPLEKFVDGKVKFSYMPKEFDANKEYNKFVKEGIKDIWVTPKVPFMIPLLIGFIVSFIFGDILFFIMNSFS
jgi:archaeal preflagellin peptidase FlaK